MNIFFNKLSKLYLISFNYLLNLTKEMNKIKLTVILAILFAGCSSQYKIKNTMDEKLIREEAHKIAGEELIFDTHMDVPLRLLWNKDLNLGERTSDGHFDYVRAKEGGLNAAFMAVYISPSYEEKGGAKKLADSIITLVNKTIIDNKDKFAFAVSPADITKNRKLGRISLPVGIENGTAVEGSIENLEHFYKSGVRYITLCHMKNNHICDSSGDPEKKWNGLSPFGTELVKKMNDLGMIIDVSHISDSAFYQVMKLSRVPVIASHSGCRIFTPGFERNMTDEMIKALADKGGVIQINFGSSIINNDVRLKYDERSKAIRSYLKENNLKYSDEQAKNFIDQYEKDHPVQNASINDIIQHIDHAVKVGGIDHVGLGSDYDGVELTPDGLEDVSKYPEIIFELLKKGYSRSDIKKICGENTMRVWKEIEEGSVK